jgi:hypothetical protein
MTKATPTMIRRALAALLLAGVLVVLGVVIERVFMTPHGDSASLNGYSTANGANSANSKRTATLASTLVIEGTVEHRSPGGPWRRLGIGETVGIDDEVRTGSSSRARLQLGSQVTVELADNTNINVAQLSETLSRIRLHDGRVVSEVRATNGFLFRVQVQGNNSQAEASAGRFGVLRRNGNPATFAAEQGSVTVTGAGQSVTLKQGEQTVVADNEAPSAPTKLPNSLLLKLGKPPPSRLRERQVQVTGETSPGAVVTVGTNVVAPNETGQFKSTVALIDGPNEIRVQVEDVAGRKQTADIPRITVDSSPPPVSGKVVW